MKFHWEKIHEDPYANTSRVKIFGGWIVHSLTESPHKTICESMIFISDPQHEWIIDKE